MSQLATKFIKNNAVTNTKLAQMAAHTYKGNNTGSTANSLDVTSTQLTADLNTFTSSLQGLVPSSGGGTVNFLRADGTWAAPAGVTSVSVVSANGLAGTVATATTTPAITLSTTLTTPIIAGNGTSLIAATTTGTGSTAVLSTGPTLSNPIVGTQTQGDSSTKAASTSYVDVAVANAVAGVNPAVAVQAATTSASDTSSFTYNNGASGIGATFTGIANTSLTIDGFTFTTLGQRLLVKNDTQSPSGAFNGIYSVTQIQTSLLPLVLTRALDYDQPSDINNTGAIPVINGTVNSTTSWVETALIVTVGTTPLVFVEFTRNPADYLLKANNLSDVASKATSYNNLSPMTTTGDIEYEVSTGIAARLPIGSTNQVLSVVAGIPAWSTPAGGIITAWAPYTMVITGSTSNPTLGTTSINQAVWRQVGDSIEIIYTLLQTGAGTAGSGVYLFSLPNSYAIDTTKQIVNVLIEQSVVGPAKVNVSASSARPAYVYAYDTTHLALSDLTTATDGAFASIGSSLYAVTNANLCYTFTARIPIVGLSVFALPATAAFYNGYFPGSGSNFWSTTSASYVDFTANGTIPSPTQLQNLGFGTVNGAASSLPGISFTAPRSGWIKVTAIASIVPGNVASQSIVGLRIFESSTSTIVDLKAQESGGNSAGNQYPTPLSGYFLATSGSSYTFKLQGKISASTLFIGVFNTDNQLSFEMQYVT